MGRMDDGRIQKQADSLRRFIDWGDSAELWADRCHTEQEAFSRLQNRESVASRGQFLNYGLPPLILCNLVALSFKAKAAGLFCAFLQFFADVLGNAPSEFSTNLRVITGLTIDFLPPVFFINSMDLDFR